MALFLETKGAQGAEYDKRARGKPLKARRWRAK